MSGAYTRERGLASLDGQVGPAAEASISILDEGLIRGDGVFEVIRLIDGRPFLFEAHLDRMARSAENLRLPFDRDAVIADTDALLGAAYADTPTGETHPDHAALRIMLTRGGRRILLTEPLHPLGATSRLASITYAPPRILDGIKSLSYAANMLMARLAREQGADDAVAVTPHGTVLESSTSSIFWVRDGRLLTPPLSDHILASITRQLVIDVVAAADGAIAGGPVIERSVSLTELLEADEAFLASTMRDVQPIAAIDARSFVTPGPITATVAAAVADWVEGWRADA